MKLGREIISVSTPLIVSLHLDNLTTLRRKARVEWLQIRDNLDAQQNAEYIDTFITLDDQIRKFRNMLEEVKYEVQAQLN